MTSPDRHLTVQISLAVSAGLYVALAAVFLLLSADAPSTWALPDARVHIVLLWLQVILLGIGSFMLVTARRSLRINDRIGIRATLLNTCAKGIGWLGVTAVMAWTLAAKGFVPWNEGTNGGTTNGGTVPTFYAIGGLFLLGHVVYAMSQVMPMAFSRQAPDPAKLATATLIWHYVTGLAAASAVGVTLFSEVL